MSVLDTLKATHKLRDSGLDEATAGAIIEVVHDATDELVTRDILRAELNGALLRFGLAFGFGMFGIMLGVAAASLAVAQWMFG